MNRRRVILFAAGFSLLIMAFLIWVLIPSPVLDPLYQGQHLSYWLTGPGISMQTDPHDGLVNLHVVRTVTDGHRRSSQVVPPLDTNSLPFLLKILNHPRRPFDRPYTRFWTAAPRWLQGRLPLPGDAEFNHAAAAVLVSQLGDAGRPAIPALLKNLAKDNPAYRVYSIYALGKIGNNSQAIRNAINDYLANTNANLGNSNYIATARTALNKLNHRPSVP